MLHVADIKGPPAAIAFPHKNVTPKPQQTHFNTTHNEDANMEQNNTKPESTELHALNPVAGLAGIFTADDNVEDVQEIEASKTTDVIGGCMNAGFSGFMAAAAKIQ